MQNKKETKNAFDLGILVYNPDTAEVSLNCAALVYSSLRQKITDCPSLQRQLFSEPGVTQSLSKLAEKANKLREEDHLERLWVNPTHIKSLFDLGPALEKLVLRIPQGNKGYQHYRVLSCDADNVVEILHQINIEKRPTRNKRLVLERSSEDAEIYRNTIFYPALASAFNGLIPTKEQVYEAAKAQALGFISRRLQGRTLDSESAQDIASQLIIDIIPYLEGTRGMFNAESFEDFIYACCRNILINRASKSKHAPILLYEDNYISTDRIDSKEETKAVPDMAALKTLLPKLAPKQRRALELLSDGKTRQEIARILSIEEKKRVSKSRLSERINSAKKRLNKIIANPGQYPDWFDMPEDQIRLLAPKLTTPLREVILLTLEGKSDQQITKILEEQYNRRFSINTVSGRTTAARKKLVELSRDTQKMNLRDYPLENILKASVSLTKNQRLVIELHLRGLSTREAIKFIQETTGKSITLSTFSSHLSTGRKRILQQLEAS